MCRLGDRVSPILGGLWRRTITTSGRVMSVYSLHQGVNIKGWLHVMCCNDNMRRGYGV